MIDISHAVPHWAKNMVSGINTEVPFYNRQIDSYVVIGESKATVNSIKNLGESNIETLSSFDLTKHLPDPFKNNSSVISKLFDVVNDESKSSWVKLVKLINHNLNYNQVAKIFDHMNAWVHCLNLNKPVIVVEAGTVFVNKPPVIHLPYNSIVSLSSTQPLEYSTNLHCISNTYAYSIDTLAAQECFSSFLKEGLYDTLEKMLRIDKYAVYHNKCAIHIKI